MAEIVGLEPTMPASKAGALTTWPYPNIVETHAGLEPVIAAVKGLCPNLLDEWAVLQGDELPAYSSGYGMIRHQNIINSHMQQGCQRNKIIDRGECSSILPFVDGLRRIEPERHLQVVNR